MTDFYGNIEQRLADYENRLLRGEPRVQAWAAAWDSQFRSGAVPMTKAEIIMRREEALRMVWPLIEIIPGAIVPQDPCPVVEDCDVRSRYSELLFGSTPGRDMCDLLLKPQAICHHNGWYETYNSVECLDCGKVW